MKPGNLLISLALLTFVAQVSQAAFAQTSPQPVPESPQPSSPPSVPASPQTTQSSLPDWVKRIGKSYQGEFWKAGRMINGSTLFYLSNQTGLTGMYIAAIPGSYITGDLTNCQAKSDRTIQCQWRETNQSGGFDTGEFNATFSPDFLSFKGTEVMKGDTKQYAWQGSRQSDSAAVFP